MEATSTHRVTMPRKVSDLIARRAKARSTSFSQEILGLVEDAIGREEEGHIWEIALEREKTCTGDLISDDEFWKLADEVPYRP